MHAQPELAGRHTNRNSDKQAVVQHGYRSLLQDTPGHLDMMTEIYQ